MQFSADCPLLDTAATDFQVAPPSHLVTLIQAGDGTGTTGEGERVPQGGSRRKRAAKRDAAQQKEQNQRQQERNRKQQQRHKRKQVRKNDRRSDTVLLVGTGSETSSAFHLDARGYVVAATVVVTDASDTFAADLIGPDGTTTLFPTQTLTGPATFTGETTITIDTAGNYAVDVTTDSEWTLEFDPA